MQVVACVDVGSTFTKAAAVDVDTGELLASAAHPTTISTDVLEGLDTVVAAVSAQVPRGRVDDVRACSSAGGGLRLAVVGYERAVTAEAGYRVGLSAGARVVHVAAGELSGDDLAALVTSRPDIVLLAGGTDGGDEDVVRHNARRLAAGGPRVPYVVACNAEVRDEVVETLRRRRRAVVETTNVLPRIGVLDPHHARAAIREAFIHHVIGGKGLSRGPRFGRLVRGATPDLVLTGVEVLADGAGDVPGAGDVLVVDVGGATTDVYSVVSPDPDLGGRHVDVVETLWRGRTVEGDLGMRWSAPGVVDAAVAERLLAGPADEDRLRAAATVRHDDVGLVPAPGPSGDGDRRDDESLARLALTVALRRHARPVELPGGGRGAARDLRRVSVVVGSGGALRHAAPDALERILSPATGDLAGGWRVPERARMLVDRRYVLAAAGLIAPDHADAAARLLARALEPC